MRAILVATMVLGSGCATLFPPKCDYQGMKVRCDSVAELQRFDREVEERREREARAAQLRSWCYAVRYDANATPEQRGWCEEQFAREQQAHEAQLVNAQIQAQQNMHQEQMNALERQRRLQIWQQIQRNRPVQTNCTPTYGGGVNCTTQ